MTKDSNSAKQARGVGCDVRHCRYHSSTEDRCEAAHIEVQNKSALSKGETYCGTFLPRPTDL